MAFLRDLDPQRPTAVRLLDEPLVLWFDRTNQSWRAFVDRCPHRLVPLSEGRINRRGELECPYHGWSFSGDGRCSHIPQVDADQPGGDTPLNSPRSRCISRAVASGQGLLFVFSGAADVAANHPLPLVPLLDEPGWLVQDTFRDLPYDALTLLENVLDVSHVPFTHHATVGNRDSAGAVNLEVTASGAQGFTGIWQEGPRRGKLGTQHTSFSAPQLMWHDLTAKGFARILTVVYATPISPGRCRLFARFPFQFEKPITARLLQLRPRWLQHLGNHRVLEDDQLFLHQQERSLAAAGGSAELSRSCFLASRSDRYVQELHKWVLQHGGTPFPGAELPPSQPTQQLMERYNSHTLHCRSCFTALRRLERIQRWAPALIVLLLVLLGLSSALLPSGVSLLLSIAVVIVLLSALQSRRWLEALRQGSPHPPRNQA